MNACDHIDTLLSAYIEQDASPAEVRFVEGHLTACVRCRDQVRDFRELVQRLRFLPRVETTPGFTERVLAEARRRPPAGLEEPVYPRVAEPGNSGRNLFHWGVPLAAAAALAVVTWLGLSVINGGTLPGNRGLGMTDVARQETRPALDFDKLAEAREVLAREEMAREEMAREELARATTRETGSPVGTPPVTRLTDENPALAGADTDPALSLGMANDQYVLEDWILREPAGGGKPVLTRVGRSPDKPVVVSF